MTLSKREMKKNASLLLFFCAFLLLCLFAFSFSAFPILSLLSLPLCFFAFPLSFLANLLLPTCFVSQK